MKCWGFRGSGRLGDGENTNRSYPVTVLDGDDSDVLSLAVGTFERSYHCEFLLSSCVVEPVTLSLSGNERSINNDDAPTITISGVPADQTAALYSDSSCTTSISSGDTLSDEGVHQYYFKVTGEERRGCSASSLSYLLDTTDPATPTITLSGATLEDTSLTSSDSTPDVVISDVSKGELVRVYSDATCATKVGQKRVEGGSVTLTVSTLATEGTYNFYAKAADSAGNESACSSASIDYIYDTTSK